MVVVGALGAVAVLGAWSARDHASCELPAVAIARPAPVPSVFEAEAQLVTAQRHELIARLRERSGAVTVVRRAYGCTGSVDVEQIELDGLRARRSKLGGAARPLAIEPATWHRLAEALTLSTEEIDDGDDYASIRYVIGDVMVPASSDAGAAIGTALAPLAAQMQADQQADYADTVVELTVHRLDGERERYRIDRAGIARRDRTGWTPIELLADLTALDLIDAVLAEGVPRTAADRGALHVREATVLRAGAVRRLIVLRGRDSPLDWL